MSDTLRKRSAGLGRGLSSLLGETAPDAHGRDDLAVRTLPLASIEPHPGQPRRYFDEDALDELAESIRLRGLIQPIVVRPNGHNYQIVAGERRWRAAQKAKLHDVPVIIKDYDDAATLEVALLENVQRQDLNAIEEALGYQRLIEEFGHTQEALGKLVHKSRSHISNLLRLLDLPQKVRDYVAVGELSMGHARALVPAQDPQAYADEVVRRGLSVRDTEKLVRVGLGRKPAQPQLPHRREANDDVDALQRQLGDLLGLKVVINHSSAGGTVSLGYSTLDQLDMICQRLSGERI